MEYSILNKVWTFHVNVKKNCTPKNELFLNKKDVESIFKCIFCMLCFVICNFITLPCWSKVTNIVQDDPVTWIWNMATCHLDLKRLYPLFSTLADSTFQLVVFLENLPSAIVTLSLPLFLFLKIKQNLQKQNKQTKHEHHH